jgi:protein SCO1/2
MLGKSDPIRALFIGACLLGLTAFGQEHHEHHHGGDRAAAPPRISIPDVQVVDQHGRRLHFYSDLVKGKVIAINFIFTTCTTICPPLGATFSMVQRMMGDRLGKQVHLISISVDPLTDTPDRLKRWGEKFNARPGWSLITGDKAEIDKLLSALGGFVARKEDHSPTVLIGNEAAGTWTRAYGLAPASKLVEIIEKMIGSEVKR